MPITPNIETVWVYHARTGLNAYPVAMTTPGYTFVSHAGDECAHLDGHYKCGSDNLNALHKDIETGVYASHNPQIIVGWLRKKWEAKQRTLNGEFARLVEAEAKVFALTAES